MRSSNRSVKNPISAMGRTLMALVLVFAIGAVSMAPPAFGSDHRGHHERWRHYGYRPYGYYYGYPYRPYGYYYHYPYRPYGYYYYPSPVYGPPIAYAPYPPPGVSFVFPIRIR